MLFGEGISREGCILDRAIDSRIIVKSGSWFSYGDLRMAQGRENARTFLKDNPELCNEIEEKIRVQLEDSRLKAEAEAEAKRAAREAARNATSDFIE